jgi:hypothetical protein
MHCRHSGMEPIPLPSAQETGTTAGEGEKHRGKVTAKSKSVQWEIKHSLESRVLQIRDAPDRRTDR